MEHKVFVCTVHIGTEPLWSVLQPKFIRAYLPNSTIVAAIDDRMGGAPNFDHVEVLDGAHREKLDELGRRVTERMAKDENNIIIFLDGDAFPIRPLMPLISEWLRDAPLAAICREENEEDYPHPSFCVTTVGFWKKLGGTWEVSSDPASQFNELGGGKLRDLLKEQGITWRRLLRSNAFNPHPVMFGLYAGTIYHHATGFRRPVTAADRKALKSDLPVELFQDGKTFDQLISLIADRNQAMSSTFRWLIQHVPEFHRILEERDWSHVDHR